MRKTFILAILSIILIFSGAISAFAAPIDQLNNSDSILYHSKSIQLPSNLTKKQKEILTSQIRELERSENSGIKPALVPTPIFIPYVVSSYEYDKKKLGTFLENKSDITQKISKTVEVSLSMSGSGTLAKTLAIQLGFEASIKASYTAEASVPAKTTYYVDQIDHWKHVQGKYDIYLLINGVLTHQGSGDWSVEVPQYVGWSIR
ncbi:hypothetical protein [Paenibacillus woosongensis]|uniref:Deacetylase PdaC domain-containing protein n=1 Tax=Paenibacillus woosongensis TaxID=307580 RepID=A0A7X2Z1E4_9BACL|nr:hypothetical protein [Paenibacillus woosongensis]MUG44974.1 hypothetical protein [Paenibacillus woosongensis]